jgi:hypothetical protein
LNEVVGGFSPSLSDVNFDPRECVDLSKVSEYVKKYFDDLAEVPF